MGSGIAVNESNWSTSETNKEHRLQAIERLTELKERQKGMDREVVVLNSKMYEERWRLKKSS